MPGTCIVISVIIVSGFRCGLGWWVLLFHPSTDRLPLVQFLHSSFQFLLALFCCFFLSRVPLQVEVVILIIFFSILWSFGNCFSFWCRKTVCHHQARRIDFCIALSLTRSASRRWYRRLLMFRFLFFFVRRLSDWRACSSGRFHRCTHRLSRIRHPRSTRGACCEGYAEGQRFTVVY